MSTQMPTVPSTSYVATTSTRTGVAAAPTAAPSPNRKPTAATPAAPRFLETGDGSGRAPRPVQVTALRWLEDNWHAADVFVLNVPVGGGKSYIAETVKRTTGGHVLTPTNLLIDQYIDTYAGANFLKGKDHYNCKSGLTCADWVDTCEMEPCADCPYQEAKARATTESTFFNPMSYWYFGYQNEGAVLPPSLVVDEAHGLASFLSMLAGVRLRRSEYAFPATATHEVALCLWLSETADRLRKLRDAYRGNRREYLRISQEIKQLDATRRGVEEAPENYAIWIESGHYRGKVETYLNVKPVVLPRYIADRALAAQKVVLLSGTLPETDVRELVGDRPYLYLDLPSPIPVERRRVFADPVDFRLNYETPPAKLAAAIQQSVESAPGAPATLVHVSYDLGKKLRPHLPKAWHANATADQKEAQLEAFKRDGGVFLAAGCAEGLDLKGDLCRHNIIPKLIYPNLGDPVVKKRRAMADGEEWYAVRTLTTLIQQAGRSTRSEADWSVTRVRDPNFARLYSRWKHKLPASFREAVVWRRPTSEDFKW